MGVARGEPRDLRWVRAGVKCGLVSVPTLRLRLKVTDFFDDAERATAVRHVESLAASRPKS
jgi:hypothetical protein